LLISKLFLLILNFYFTIKETTFAINMPILITPESPHLKPLILAKRWGTGADERRNINFNPGENLSFFK